MGWSATIYTLCLAAHDCAHEVLIQHLHGEVRVVVLACVVEHLRDILAAVHEDHVLAAGMALEEARDIVDLKGRKGVTKAKHARSELTSNPEDRDELSAVERAQMGNVRERSRSIDPREKAEAKSVMCINSKNVRAPCSAQQNRYSPQHTRTQPKNLEAPPPWRQARKEHTYMVLVDDPAVRCGVMLRDILECVRGEHGIGCGAHVGGAGLLHLLLHHSRRHGLHRRRHLLVVHLLSRQRKRFPATMRR